MAGIFTKIILLQLLTSNHFKAKRTKWQKAPARQLVAGSRCKALTETRQRALAADVMAWSNGAKGEGADANKVAGPT